MMVCTPRVPSRPRAVVITGSRTLRSVLPALLTMTEAVEACATVVSDPAPRVAVAAMSATPRRDIGCMSVRFLSGGTVPNHVDAPSAFLNPAGQMLDGQAVAVLR